MSFGSRLTNCCVIFHGSPIPLFCFTIFFVIILTQLALSIREFKVQNFDHDLLIVW
jgi:hypothetical protein